MAVPKHVTMPKKVVLTHKQHQKPDADPMDVVISVDDSVKWDYLGNFFVVFEHETPFESWNFFSGNANSGLPRKDVKHNHPYKYTVYIDGDRLDPNVIIRP